MKRILAISVVGLLILSGCTINKTPAVKINEDASEVCGKGSGCSTSKKIYQGYKVGDQIPNVDLVKADGTTEKLYDLLKNKNKTIISFAADWCSDCQREEKKLNEYYKNLPEDYEAILIFVDYDSKDGTKTTNEEQMKNYIKNNDFASPVFYDKNNELSDKLGGIKATPTNIILDSQGTIKGITEEVDMDLLFLENKTTVPEELTKSKK